MKEFGGWVYIMSSHSRCLYIGVTSDLFGRVQAHKNGLYKGFSEKYKVHLLVYHECFHEHSSRDRAGEAAEGLDAGQEDRTHRENEPGLGRPHAR